MKATAGHLFARLRLQQTLGIGRLQLLNLQKFVIVGWVFTQGSRRDDQLFLPLCGLCRLLLSLLVPKDRQSLLLEKQYVIVPLWGVSQQQSKLFFGWRLIAAALVPHSM